MGSLYVVVVVVSMCGSMYVNQRGLFDEVCKSGSGRHHYICQ